MKERIIMRKKDLYRFEILTNIQKKRLKQVEAAQNRHSAGASIIKADGCLWSARDCF